MPLHLAETQDRFRASVLGLAVGDALGFPLRGIPAASLRRLPALAEDFVARPRGRYAKGQFTDDTQVALAAVESLALEKKVDGRSLAAHLAWLWHEGVILQPPPTLTAVAQRLLQGVPWMSAGAPLGVRDPSALPRALAVGLWDAEEDLARLAHDAATLCVVTHKDPLCAAAAAAFAQAVALMATGEPPEPRAFCAQLAAVASIHDEQLGEELRHLPRLLSWDVERALAQLRRVGVPASLLDETEGLPPHVTPVLLTALFAAFTAPADFRAALTLVLQQGGEVDSAAALAGALLGARLGCDGIPARLRRNVLYADHLLASADRLFTARRESVRASVVERTTLRRRR